MHICYLCNEYPSFPHGGVGSFTQTLARAMVQRGHAVTSLGIYRSLSSTVSEDDHGVRVIRLPSSSLPKTGYLVNGRTLRRALSRIHRENPIDVLEGPENAFAAIPQSFPTAKLIRMHGGHHFFSITLGKKPRLWRSWLERRSFRNADVLCGVSRFVAETTRQLLQLGNRPIEVIPNPIDLTLFRAQSSDKETDGLILYVGAVCEKKGIRQLVEAMPQILRSVPTAKLLVVGRDGLDERTGTSFTANLRAQIPPEIADRIVFQGGVDRKSIPDLIASASVCVYPSHMEAMPIAWLEGLAMGKAVVASQTGPGPEVIQDGETGLLCDPHDPTSIANCIIEFLQDPARRRQLGQQARQRIVESFSLEVLVDRNEIFYQNCRTPCPLS